MLGVPSELAEHQLHVDKNAKEEKHSLRPVNEERCRVIDEEIAWLLAARVGWRIQSWY